MMNKNTHAVPISIKEVSEEGIFEGYASIFGNVDLGGDVVVQGAFAESLKNNKQANRIIPMLWQHDRFEPIGAWLEIREDKKGLFVRGELMKVTERARGAYELLKKKALGGLSIGFQVAAGGAADDEQSHGVRKLFKLNLREISLVTMPMNEEAVVTAVKSEAKELRDRLASGDQLSIREMEKLLKGQLGLSNSEAERAVRLNFKKWQGDPAKSAKTHNEFYEAILAHK